MWKGALVGAVALTTVTMSVASAQQQLQSYSRSESQAGVVVTEAHISRLKSALNLTGEQQAYWAPVEAALRDIARQAKAESAVGAGMVQRMSDRASAAAGDAMRLRRLATAARPLIRVLDDNQKRDAMTLVRNFGFDRFVAAF